MNLWYFSQSQRQPKGNLGARGYKGGRAGVGKQLAGVRIELGRVESD